MNDAQSEGRELRRLRLDAGYGVTQLARAAQINRSHIYSLESGQKRIGDHVLIRLAEVYGLKPSELMDRLVSGERGAA